MTIPSLIRAELARLTATPLARLAFIALMIVPLLYGGAYLWANRDPYAKLDQVPAAIVDQDAGATLDGERVDYGEDVTKQALDGADFKWTETSAADARSGVRNGTYDFVVTIPHDFSESLVSAQGDDPKRAELVMTTADTNSYLASTIAEQAGKTMRTAVAERVGKQAAKTLLVGLADVRDSLGDAVDGAGQLASGATSAADGARQLASGTDQLSAGASQLAAGTAELPSQTRQLADGAGQVASGASSLASGLADAQRQTADLPAQTQQLAGGAKQVSDNLTLLTKKTDPALQALQIASPDTVTAAITQAAADRGVTLTPEQQAVVAATVQAQLQDEKTQQQLADAKAALQGFDQLRDGSQQVTDGAAQLAAAAPTLSNGIASAASGASQLSTGASQVSAGTSKLADAAPTLSSGASSLASGAASAASGASSLSSGVDQLESGSKELASKLDQGRTKIPASTASQRNAQASVISDPVKVGDDNVAAASNYGAGLAPFFISLAAWIGMYALFLILKPISKRAITAVRKPLSVVLGGWLTPALLGVVQMAALFLIVRFALDLDVVHAGSTVGVMVLASATFAAIIMALNVLLGSVGQFLGLVLMLVQLVTAGGTFPWQTLPGPLAALHFALPMTYSVDALRQTMYGGSMSAVWSDVGVLACWLLGALLVSLVVTARQTRTRTLRDLRPSLIG
ncbi:YhgE/Pip domain-containing protein [Curtobacterium sp. Csp1]|uniref:YhgE/Pip domain-containing protein n=1 Tax=unclassified Curtobacterium TaxID=257496 RepID=UPI0015980CFC|nr:MULTISPECIES: YhgE/Pip domain-containing protein [unclassified Curtobacterium]QKS12477.1 YhgE/Pip domain-containing protein [Curtobacterium sp. csp3]QKS20074.1 YhgE/Pip domain-containing protein [Curtobacterium sp. Csp1]